MNLRNYFFCFLGILLFATLEIAGKLIGENISPTAITAYRFLLGSLLLLFPAIHQWKKLPQKIGVRDWLKMAYPGCLNVGIAMFSLQLSIYYGKASMAAILISSNSIFVAIFAALILKEKLKIGRAHV